VAAATVVFTILAAYPLWFQFFGPQQVSGNVQATDVYVSDLLAFVFPGWLMHFTGNATENDAFVGLPLLLLFATGLILGRDRPWVRWSGLMAVAIAVLSLGPHLHVNGQVTPLLMPWAAIEWLPLMGSALPSRLMVIGFLFFGIVVAAAYGLALGSTRAWRFWGGALLAAGLISIFPSLPYPSAQAAAPQFFRAGGGVERIAPGSVVLVTPFSSKESTDAMYWQATANYRFRMPEGDAFTPGPYLGPHPSFMQSTLDELDAGQSVTVTPEVRTLFVADLQAHGITAIVAGPSKGRAAIVDFLTQVEGSPPDDSGGVKVWWQLN